MIKKNTKKQVGGFKLFGTAKEKIPVNDLITKQRVQLGQLNQSKLHKQTKKNIKNIINFRKHIDKNKKNFPLIGDKLKTNKEIFNLYKNKPKNHKDVLQNLLQFNSSQLNFFKTLDKYKKYVPHIERITEFRENLRKSINSTSPEYEKQKADLEKYKDYLSQQNLDINLKAIKGTKKASIANVIGNEPLVESNKKTFKSGKFLVPLNTNPASKPAKRPLPPVPSSPQTVEPITEESNYATLQGMLTVEQMRAQNEAKMRTPTIYAELNLTQPPKKTSISNKNQEPEAPPVPERLYASKNSMIRRKENKRREASENATNFLMIQQYGNNDNRGKELRQFTPEEFKRASNKAYENYQKEIAAKRKEERLASRQTGKPISNKPKSSLKTKTSKGPKGRLTFRNNVNPFASIANIKLTKPRQIMTMQDYKKQGRQEEFKRLDPEEKIRLMFEEFNFEGEMGLIYDGNIRGLYELNELQKKNDELNLGYTIKIIKTTINSNGNEIEKELGIFKDYYTDEGNIYIEFTNDNKNGEFPLDEKNENEFYHYQIVKN